MVSTTGVPMVYVGSIGEGATYVGGINNRKQVVGWASDRAFVWHKGQLADLYASSGWYGQPQDINERGQAVGLGFTTWRGALWEDGQLQDLPELLMAYAINNSSQVVGRVGPFPYTAAVWEDGTVTELGSLGPWSSYGFDINEKGQVTGSSFAELPGPEWQHAFVWEESTGMVDLGTLGGLASYGYQINDRGHIVGRSSVVPGQHYPQHPFLWTPRGMMDLGTLADETVSAYARAVNNNDQVVGGGRTWEGTWHAFLWDKGEMCDLGCLPGGDQCEANDISESGVIAGYSEDANGDHVAVLWIPKGCRP
jgi:probable HAF family extracellular repeat protein